MHFLCVAMPSFYRHAQQDLPLNTETSRSGFLHVAYLALRRCIVVMINSYSSQAIKTKGLCSQGLYLINDIVCPCHFTDVNIEDHRMDHAWSRTDMIQLNTLGGN